jgi:proline iminopeptidase
VLFAACTSPAGAPPEEGFVEVDGARLFYRAIGEGETIVVVHGGPGLDHTYLLPGMARLAETHRVIFYDQRALGRSSGETAAPGVSFDGYVEDLDRLREALGIEAMNLLGHSWGAFLATGYALRHPENLASLILVSPVEPGRRYLARAAQNQRARQTTRDSALLDSLMSTPAVQNREPGAINAVFRVSFRSTFSDPTRAEDLVVDFPERTIANGSQVASLVMGPLGDYDLWGQLGGITAPTLVVHGDRDPIPADMARAMADSLVNAEFVLLEEAGHFPFVERPDVLFPSIERFLADLRSEP